MDSLQIQGGLAKKGAVVFLKGVDNLVHTMYIFLLFRVQFFKFYILTSLLIGSV